MSKVIQVNIKRWEGSVTLADPLAIPQALLIEAALEEPELELKDAKPEKVIWASIRDKHMLPAVIGCVESWDLKAFPKNVTFDTFPASPRGDSAKLIRLIFSEIMQIYNGEKEIPNG